MSPNRWSYAAIGAFVAAMACFLSAFTDHSRIVPGFENFFFYEKIAFGTLWLIHAYDFQFRESRDYITGLFFAEAMIYILINMWMLPLYELAYVEFAIVSSFIRLQRRWIFPTVYGVGLLAILSTYKIQDSIHWELPPIVRMDWIWTMVLFFIVAWLIESYAIGSMRREDDRQSRFSLIGLEFTRLLHDLKGLLSSPILIIDALRAKDRELTSDELERHLRMLSEDMGHVREALKSMNRLVVTDDRVENIHIRACLDSSIHVLKRRLAGVIVDYPEDRHILAHPDRLHSVFFNLLLNSLEAFHRNGTPEPRIEIFWKKDALIFRDNAGPSDLSIRRDLGSGLGLRIVQNDMQRMRAKFRMYRDEHSVVFSLHFRKANAS